MGRKKTITRRPTYRDAVRWCAFNDNAGDDEAVEQVQDYVTTLLVADTFGVPERHVAIDIVRTRHGAGPFAVRSEGSPHEG